MKELQEKILKLKKEKNAVLLVHNYQRPEIQEIADYLGDSLGLAREATKTDADIILFCGVRFMAETAKILSPEKKVLLPEIGAGCPMADMADIDEIKRLKKENPDAMVVSYVNTYADVKAITDVCCTSGNALNVVKNIEADTIIFTPDQNLGDWVQRHTDKKMIMPNGYCYVHHRIVPEEVIAAKAAKPEALLIVHPECPREIVDLGDFVGSTEAMISFAENSSAKEFLVATEAGLIHRLNREIPNKKFYSAGNIKMCSNMKKITLENILEALEKEQYEITLSDELLVGAKASLDRMLEYV